MNMRTIGIAVIVVALVAAMVPMVSAVPDGATGTAGTAVTKAAVTATTDDAKGGNITEFDLSVLQQTNKWQGYYGNTTGEVTLDDATGNTMYDWAISAPAGEVYATTLGTLPSWYTFDDTAATLGTVNAAYNFESDASDNADDTFSVTNNTAFDLAGNTIAADFAPNVLTYGAVEGTGAWETAILYDGDGTATTDFLFVGIIAVDQPSFLSQDGTDTCDYQMIIPEDPTDEGIATTYSFYMELT